METFLAEATLCNLSKSQLRYIHVYITGCHVFQFPNVVVLICAIGKEPGKRLFAIGSNVIVHACHSGGGGGGGGGGGAAAAAAVVVLVLVLVLVLVELEGDIKTNEFPPVACTHTNTFPMARSVCIFLDAQK